MIFRKVYLVPVIFGLWLPITFIITYIVAVLTQHVKPILPYISDTGSWAPESCIFGMMLTLGGMLLVMTIYIRFRQVKDLTEKNDLGVLTLKLNKSGLYLGFLATLGCLIVAHFQVTNVFEVHIMGALLCFGLGTVFQIIQVIISYRIHPSLGNKTVNIIRSILAFVSVTSFVCSSVAGLIAWLNFDGEDMTKWTPAHRGYLPHVISAFTEYVLAFSTTFFIVTFCEEFKTIHFQEPQLIVP